MQATAFQLSCATDLGAGPLPVFPLLMPANWTPPAATTLCQPLIAGTQLADISIVALAYLEPIPNSIAPNRSFIRSDRAEVVEQPVETFWSEAFHNVGQLAGSWLIEDFIGTRIAMYRNHYLAAERILDRAFLAEASRLLGDDQLCVGIPARGQLWATAMGPAIAEPAGLRAFAMMMKDRFEAARSMPITPWPMLVVNGEIVAALELG